MGFKNLDTKDMKKDEFKKPTKKDIIKDEFKEGINFEVPIDEKNKDEFDKIIKDAIEETKKEEEEVNSHDNQCCLKVRDKLQDIYELNKEQDHKLSNLNKTFLIMFMAGTAFGMSDNKWLPYASMIWEFGKDIIGKG